MRSLCLLLSVLVVLFACFPTLAQSRKLDHAKEQQALFAAGHNRWTNAISDKWQFDKHISLYIDHLYEAFRMGNEASSEKDASNWVSALLSSNSLPEDVRKQLLLERSQLKEFCGEEPLARYEIELEKPTPEQETFSSIAKLMEIAKKNRPTIWTSKIKDEMQLNQLVEYYGCLRDPKHNFAPRSFEPMRNTLRSFAGDDVAFSEWECDFLKPFESGEARGK